jgi:hypothetical protein
MLLRTSTTICASLLGFTSAACFTAELDPNRNGVFVCSTDDECPKEGACINARCEMEPAPTVTIRLPEPQQQFGEAARGNAAQIPIELSMSISNLVLRDPSANAEHVFGEGHIVITLDGKRVATVPSEDVPAFVDVANTPGAHRLRAAIVRNDGIPYDHARGSANRLFWFDDGDPHVAIVSPWPNTVFPLEATGPVIIEIETLNFTITSREGGEAMLEGHAHAHYDPVDMLRDCFEPNPLGLGCNDGYIGLINGRTEAPCSSNSSACGEIEDGFPAADQGSVSLWVTLRHANHQPYYHPFGSDDDAGGETDTDADTDTEGETGEGGEGRPRTVVDEILISRGPPPGD